MKKRGNNKFAMKGVTKAELTRLYHTEKLSQPQIAEIFGVTQGAIFYWMKALGIEARGRTDALILNGKSDRFKGEKNPRWAGGRYVNAAGYVFVYAKDHPEAQNNKGYAREHRLVWHNAKGPIPKGWHIHHKNGDKSNNRLENLELMTHADHQMVIPQLLKRIHELEQEIRRLKNESKSNPANPCGAAIVHNGAGGPHTPNHL